MQFPSLFLSPASSRIILSASVGLLGLVIFAFSISLWAATRFGADQKLTSTESVKVLHFTLTPLGFNPSEMTVPEGMYVIEVTNRSDLSRFSLNLGRLSNHKLKEINAARTHGEWSGFFRLKSDDYLLVINEKTAWKANLRVTK